MPPLQCASVCLCCRPAQEIDALLDLDHLNVVGLKEYFVQNNRVRGGQWPSGKLAAGRAGAQRMCGCRRRSSRANVPGRFCKFTGGLPRWRHSLPSAGLHSTQAQAAPLCPPFSCCLPPRIPPLPLQVYLIMELLQGGELLDSVLEQASVVL